MVQHNKNRSSREQDLVQMADEAIQSLGVSMFYEKWMALAFVCILIVVYVMSDDKILLFCCQAKENWFLVQRNEVVSFTSRVVS
mmetsp:Transcript_20854/g.35130  ORF Transcript_20854/g.35130 Transcript_20854/m.35130 type:complete len:84 (+) Transcript_20854:346-597(+)